jgi:hypothetical protein
MSDSLALTISSGCGSTGQLWIDAAGDPLTRDKARAPNVGPRGTRDPA